MNANYLYEIFETTRENHAPDLNVGLAMLRETKPIPEGMTDREIREFLGKHYDKLVQAYQTGDRALFAGVAAKCAVE